MKYYNKAFVSSKDDFENSIMSQPLWGNKYITHYIRCRKNLLFLRNWIRGGIRKVGDLKFRNGVLDETFVHQKIIYKQNLYTERMLVKNTLLPYQQSIKHGTNDTSIITKVKLLKSKDVYNELRAQLICSSNIMRVSNYLTPFCNSDIEVNVFEKKVTLECEIKLKEFNFKLLHGCLPCNRTSTPWWIKMVAVVLPCATDSSIRHISTRRAARYMTMVFMTSSTKTLFTNAQRTQPSRICSDYTGLT